MKCYKRRIFAGAICEQIYYGVADGARIDRPRRPRNMTPAEREAHRNAASLRRCIRLVNANFTPEGWYATLTFDVQNEVYEFDVAKIVRRNFMRKITRAYPDAKIMAFMGRGLNGHIHFHMMIEGVPAEFIAEKWKYGKVIRIEHLRKHNYYNGVDHGADYTGLATYCWKHWTAEQGGRRWAQTRTVVQPEPEPPTLCVREYSVERPPLAPRGYRLIEAFDTRFGYLYFKYVKIPEKGKPGRPKKR